MVRGHRYAHFGRFAALRSHFQSLARSEADVKEYKIGLVAATIRLRLEKGEAGEALIM